MYPSSKRWGEPIWLQAGLQTGELPKHFSEVDASLVDVDADGSARAGIKELGSRELPTHLSAADASLAELPIPISGVGATHFSAADASPAELPVPISEVDARLADVGADGSLAGMAAESSDE